MEKIRNVLLIRHGEVENPKGVIYGRKQLYELGLKLQSLHIHLNFIFFSPMKRTLQSADELKRVFPESEIVIDDNLQEVEMAPLGGKSLDFIKQIDGDIYDAPEVKDHAIERPQIIIDRIKKAVRRGLTKAADDEAIFIISHGDPIVLLLWSLLKPNYPLPSYQEIRGDIYSKRGEAWHLVIEPESLRVISFNRVSVDIIE